MSKSVLALQQQQCEGWVIKVAGEVLGAGRNVYFDCSNDCKGISRLEFIKLYILNICRSLYVNYILMNL